LQTCGRSSDRRVPSLLLFSQICSIPTLTVPKTCCIPVDSNGFFDVLFLFFVWSGFSARENTTLCVFLYVFVVIRARPKNA
ncbi:MAG: hypothetical protein Q3X95_02200, partial [Duodenibacillus sp.]|nr:hypothetical protein [Duodenibacillus sp.]